MSGDESQNDIEQIIEELPESKPELLEGVRRLRGVRQYELADRILKHALDRAALPELRVERGRIKLGMENYRAAAATVESLFSREQPPPRAFAVVAHAKAEVGELDEARRFLEQAEQRGAVGRVVEEARTAIDDMEPPGTEKTPAPESEDPEEDTVQLADDWLRMVRATAGTAGHDSDGSDAAGDAGSAANDRESPWKRDKDSDPIPPDDTRDDPSSRSAARSDSGGATDPANEPTVELEHGTELGIPEPDGESEGRQSTGSFWVAPTDPEINQDDLFTHSPAGADRADSDAETVELQTDQIDVEAVGPSAWEVLYDSTESDASSGSRSVKIEPIDDHGEGAANIEPGDRERARPVPTDIGEKTENLDRSDLEERVKRRTPPGLVDEESDEERLVELDEAPDDDREEARTEPEVPSAYSDSDSDRWEPGDVLRPGAEPEEPDEGPSDPDADSEEESSPRAAPTVDSPESTGKTPVRSLTEGRWGRIALIAGAVLSVGLVGAVVAARVFVQQNNSALRTEREELAEYRARDTYGGWSRALDTSASALEEQEPTSTEKTIENFSVPLASADPADMRRELRLERIFAASMVEFRFETCGSRNARNLAKSVSNSDAPRLRAARVYRHLACNRPSEALRTSEKAIDAHSGAAPVVDARLAALLETGEIGTLLELVDSLSDSSESRSRYRNYLLARARAYRSRSDADDRLLEIAESGGTDHLDSRLARVELAADRADAETALETAKSLLERVGEEASSYQRARLQVAAGRAHARAGHPESARENFERAIELSPARTSIHVPAIDFELDVASLARAEKLLTSAEEQAERTPSLRVRRAEYLLQTGRYEKAAETLPNGDWVPTAAALVRARLALERGEPEAAAQHVTRVPDDHSLGPRARALEALADVVGEASDLDATMNQLENIRSKRPDGRHLTESSVRAHLAASTKLDTSASEDHLERAVEEAKVLAGHGSYSAVGERLACRSHLARGALSRASETCEKAREGSTESVDTAVASARVELMQGRPSDAQSILDGLRDELADTWPVAATRIRASVASRDYSRAETLLETWNDVEKRGDYRLLSGLLAFARGDYEPAQTALAEAEQTTGFPDASGEARLFLAHAKLRTGHYEDAKSLVEEVTDLYRYKRWGWIVFGELRRRQDDYWDALENLRIAKSIGDFPPVRPDHDAYLRTELALTWAGLKSWNHRRVPDLLEQASEAGGADYPDYLFARGAYLGYRWNPEKGEALKSVRRGLEAQPYRCDMVERLDTLHDEFDVPSGRRSIPDAARKACRDDAEDSAEE